MKNHINVNIVTEDSHNCNRTKPTSGEQKSFVIRVKISIFYPFELIKMKKEKQTKCWCILCRKIHTLEKPYKCTAIDSRGLECGVTFYDTKALNVHMLIHAEIHPYNCKTCDKKFNHSGAYKTHLRYVIPL